MLPHSPFCADPEHPYMAEGATVEISSQSPNSDPNVVRLCQKQLTRRMCNRHRQHSKMCQQPCCIRLWLFAVFLLATLTQNNTPKPTYLAFNFLKSEIFLARGIRALAASAFCSGDGYWTVWLATFSHFCTNTTVSRDGRVNGHSLSLPPSSPPHKPHLKELRLLGTCWRRQFQQSCRWDPVVRAKTMLTCSKVSWQDDMRLKQPIFVVMIVFYINIGLYLATRTWPMCCLWKWCVLSNAT